MREIWISGQAIPFRIEFKTDADEQTGAPADDAMVNEQAMTPGGIIGFSINYMQQAC